ncbi:hypothetical protein HNQ93_002685 [Hymenobacter luteus]|uniref:Uncharacterized protein n=2 Tax=Hymenobacter TaxID=89966 RepID=A0A7W9WCT1_9BACT|nr:MULTISPECIES: hypothetical protein [Hymenobacter]MBB4601746.1 hypothetical protein [Hymenobacter latericoloratus]MBB6059825.1 hypothetical protein [Hymenobacter luteus]
MNDKLILLLNYYTREQRALAKQLREAVQERDYRVAARIQKGLYLVTQQLQTLRALHNPHAEEVDRLGRQIRYLKKTKARVPMEARFPAEMLRKYEQEKQQLEAALPAPNPATTVLRECMEELLAGQIKGFHLILSKSVRLSVSIRRVRRTAILTLPELIRHRREYSIHRQQVRQLRHLEFAYYDQKDKLLAVVPMSSAEDLEQIMHLWLQITCVVFDSREFRNDSEIRYVVA